MLFVLLKYFNSVSNYFTLCSLYTNGFLIIYPLFKKKKKLGLDNLQVPYHH